MSQSDSNDLRTTLVRALREVERLRNKVASLEGASDEAIAVVGVGLRLPGGIRDLDGLWKALERELDAVGPLRDERWNFDDWYDPDPDAAGKTYAREAGFLDSIDQFDPGFFNISPREAKSIDPQHRHVLETAWEALEHAGIVPGSLAGSRTGVFVGIGASDYGAMLRQSVDGDAYVIMGTHASFAGGRIAFHLGLQGPSVSLDTACSSSLVALHLACASLRARESSLALAGGTAIMSAPETFVQLSRTRALAPDGRSKTFSDRANGYGRGEGAIVLVLERLSDARAAGRDVLAIIRGSAVNHDGPSSGITAPNGAAQQAVIRAALADAKCEPHGVDYIECHGTGTVLGDPIEVGALAAVYAKQRPKQQPLLLGTIKTNIGHLEAASGLAGVAKVIASLRQRTIPASLHSQPPNRHIDWSSMAVEVVSEPRPWTARSDGPRRAGVSSFGLSGTNAHVIVEEAPPAAATARDEAPRVATPILISARNESALRQQASNFLARIRTQRPELRELGYTLACGRTHFEHRAGFLAADLDAVEDGLTSIATGTTTSVRVTSGRARTKPVVAVMFTGQGSQTLGMGKALAEAYPSFRAAFHACNELFTPLIGRDLSTVVHAAADPDNLLDETCFTQPALFAVEVALFRLLESWGLTADIVLGHSIGELVAAHVAGVLSLEDACTLVATRGRLMQQLPAGGAMISIQASEAELRPHLDRLRGRIDVASVNGPMSTVISGDELAALEIAAHFEARGRKPTRLSVSHAFHSYQMDGMLAEFEATVADLKLRKPNIRVISNVTGQIATAAELTSPAYWTRHVRSPVRFLDGIRTLESLGASVVLELGPRGVLTSMAAGCLSPAAADAVALVPSLRGEQPEREAVASCVTQLHCLGVELDWRAYYDGGEVRRLSLPTYPWQHERHWLDRRPAAHGSTADGRYALAGQRTELPDGGSIHSIELGPGVQTYLRDHKVFDTIVVPGAFYLAIMLAIAECSWPEQPIELRNVEFVRALGFAGPDDVVTLQVRLQPADAGLFTVSLYSRGREGEWTNHANAELRPLTEAPELAVVELGGAHWSPDQADFGEMLTTMQIEWGPRWWWLAETSVLGRATVAGRLQPPDDEQRRDAPIPGGLIDNSFALVFWTPGFVFDSIPRLPFAVRRVLWSGSPELPSFAALTALQNDLEQTRSDIALLDASGRALVRIDGFATRRAPPERFFRSRAPRDLYIIDYKPAAQTPAALRTWVELGPARLFDDHHTRTRYESFAQLLAAHDRGELPSGPVFTALADDLEALDNTIQILALIQAWVGSGELADRRFVVVTRQATAVGPGDQVTGVEQAPVWGLLRTAFSEHPDLPLDPIAGSVTSRSDATASNPWRFPTTRDQDRHLRGVPAPLFWLLGFDPAGDGLAARRRSVYVPCSSRQRSASSF